MSFIAKGQAALRDEVEGALARFQKADAEFVEVSTLLPADVLLDLYGEDIRNQAFLVHDGVEGNFVLRPDFTVPVVQAHLARNAQEDAPARYAYSGRVWRKKREQISERQHSFWQVGFEIFDTNHRAQHDAEIFAMSYEIGQAHGLSVKTGDLGLVFALLDQIAMPDWRRDALKRQFWRPRAFDRLLARYSSGVGKYADISEEIDAPVIGLRSQKMILGRINRLKEDAALPPMRAEDVALLEAVLALKGNLLEVEQSLEALAKQARVLEAVSAQFAARNRALAAQKIDLERIAFDASFGRETMEYYDGFVFGFFKGEISVISGGRYDRLVQSFDHGRALAAVGMAYRPEFCLGEGA